MPFATTGSVENVITCFKTGHSFAKVVKYLTPLKSVISTTVDFLITLLPDLLPLKAALG
jgi:hypothetical protein